MLAFGLIVVFIVFVYAVSRTLKSGGTSKPLASELTVQPTADDALADNEFLLGISGESYRQDAISRCHVGDPLQLIPEPTNAYDKFAVKVCRGDGEQIGYIKKERSRQMARDLASGARYDVCIHALYPPSGARRFSAVVIHLTELDWAEQPEVTPAEVRGSSQVSPGRADIAASSSDWIISITGESKKNADGTSRQDIIRTCRQGEPIKFERDRANAKDPNCVRVVRATGEQIGELPKPWSRRLAPELDAGESFDAELFEVRGGTPGKWTLGVVIRVPARLEATAGGAR